MGKHIYSCFCEKSSWFFAALSLLSSTCLLVAEEGDGGKDNPCLDPGTKSDPWVWEGWDDCEYAKYSVDITSSENDEVFVLDSGDSATATADREGEESGISDEKDNISWSADATGTGETSGEFTTSVGNKTLTAELENETDSVSVDVVQFLSFGATDKSTQAGTREVGADGTLQMVYSGSAREAEIKFEYTSSSPDVSDRFPIWTGNKIVSPSVGDETVTFDSGSVTSGNPVSDSISAEYTTGGESKTVTVEVVEESKIDGTFSINEGLLEPIQTKINSAINAISDNGPDLTIEGSVGYEFRLVDKYDDPSAGLFADADGDLTATFPDFNFESPSIPIASTGLAIQITGSVSETTITVILNANLDESLSSPGSVSGGLSGSTTLQVGAVFGVGNTKISPGTVTLSGQTTLSANGNLQYNDKTVSLKGGLSSSAIQASWSLDAKLGVFGDYQLYSDTTTLNNTSTNFPYDIELYSF
jgi:hypothetical protein